MSLSLKRLLIIPLAATATSALAQDSDDWDLGRDPVKKAVVAAVSFDNFGIAVRCVDNHLSVLMSGLPQGKGERTLRLAMGDVEDHETDWISAGDGSTVFGLWPTSTANMLRKGGRLRVTIPAQEGVPARRYAFDLPRSDASIAAVLEACGKPAPTTAVEEEAIASRSDLAGLVWKKVPEPSFPYRNNGNNYENGVVALGCKTDARGYLKNCQIESEYPDDGGFGRAAQVAAHQFSQVVVTEGDPAAVEDRAISFVVRFSSYDDFTPVTPSRLPQNPAAVPKPTP